MVRLFDYRSYAHFRTGSRSNQLFRCGIRPLVSLFKIGCDLFKRGAKAFICTFSNIELRIETNYLPVSRLNTPLLSLPSCA